MMAAVNRHRIVLALLSIYLSLFLQSCSLAGELIEALATVTASPTPTSSQTPTPTATPTPIPSAEEEIEAGDRALFLGDWSKAIAQYESALSFASEQEEIQQALLGAGVTLYRSGDGLNAISQFERLIGDYPESTLAGIGFFYMGQAKESIGDYSGAAADYQSSLDRQPGLAETYILEIQGDALLQAGDYQGAVNIFGRAANEPRAGSNLILHIKIGNAFAALGEYESAITEYQLVYEQTGNDFTKAEMDLYMGRWLNSLGRSEEGFARYLDAVENFPLAFSSYSALVALVEAEVPVNELDRGLVDHFAGQHEVAIAAFNRYLNSVGDAHDGTVHYYKGLSLRAQGDYTSALGEWDVLIDTHPGDRLWVEAWEEKAFTLWAYLDDYDLAAVTLLDFVAVSPEDPGAAELLFDAARIAEIGGNLDLAAQSWGRVALEYPTSNEVSQASFQAGITRFRQGDYLQAGIDFHASLEAATNPTELAAAYLWIGKTAFGMGDEEAGISALQAAALADPQGYYSLRAGELLAGGIPFGSLENVDTGIDLAFERTEVEAWMISTFNLHDMEEPLMVVGSRLSTDPRFIRGSELWRLGLGEQAKVELESLQKSLENDPETTFRLMNWFLSEGLNQQAIRAARQILVLAGLEEAPVSDRPAYLKHIRFGIFFEELFLDSGEQEGLELLFLVSVARQESLFESFATSYAAARGLMQIIPSTGQELAQKLDWPPGYNDDDLYRPIVSVRLGAHYLANQRDLFEGDLYATLAAYNAGPGNSLAWYALAPNDPDLFLEVIRIQQTQDYIRSIYWAYANYTELYHAP